MSVVSLSLQRRFSQTETVWADLSTPRAAVSVPANIVEGFKKRSHANKLRFLNTAQGSLEESLYYLILAEDLTYESSEEEMTKLEEVSRLFGIVLPIYPSCPLLTPDSFLYQAKPNVQNP
jgi:four helix bundle protein